MEHAYWGRAYAREEIDAALAAHGAAYERLDEEALCAHVADELAAGRVVGWFQGRFEWGPRALGNRSILADPRSTTMKARVNETVKFREPFRPFAPSVLEERAGELVDGDPAAQLATRFMLLVLPLKDGAGEAMPAVDHFGTARVQTVRADYSPLYYRLISAFADRTGLPALLNTSFNLRGEPIVASPADALSTFARSDLDLLVLEDAVVRKR
jgi:carbamoyltransferase